MLDVFGPPPQFRGEVKIFNSSGAVNYQGYQTWAKPPYATMVMMIAISGGGGGGGGFTRIGGAPGSGGGGGASSNISRFLCPAIFLPDTLYIQVGAGGVGGAANAAGGNGTNSYITTGLPVLTIPVLPNIVCYSGVNAPGGGAAGTASGGGTAGTVPTIAVTQPFNALGEWFAFVGLVGVAGGQYTGAAGAAVTAWAASPLSPGCGGGGIATTPDFAGGAVSSTAIANFNNIYMPAGVIVAGGVAGGGNGGAGISIMSPFFQTGGSGGGTNNAGVGGFGGPGGIGCGGGGGGAGTTGGMGGNGGAGLVAIISW